MNVSTMISKIKRRQLARAARRGVTLFEVLIVLAIMAMIAGGVGMLRDVRGNDTYTAAGFAQGMGRHHGVGALMDLFSGGGDD